MKLSWHVVYIAIIISLGLIINNFHPDKEIQQIKVPVYIPEQKDTFYVEKPVPVYKDTTIFIPKYIPTLPSNPSKCIEEYTNLYNYCDSMLKTRAYKNTTLDSIFFIVGKDTIWSNINITVIDTTQGILNNQQMFYQISPKNNFITITEPVKFKNTTFVGGGYHFNDKLPVAIVGLDKKKVILNYTGNLSKTNIITIAYKF